MRSAYGRQTPPPDYELTCVEPGSPMGELLRRYWQPVCTSDELRDLPKKVKLLCEELVVFRDRKGRVGALEDEALEAPRARLGPDAVHPGQSVQEPSQIRARDRHRLLSHRLRIRPERTRAPA